MTQPRKKNANSRRSIDELTRHEAPEWWRHGGEMQVNGLGWLVEQVSEKAAQLTPREKSFLVQVLAHSIEDML